MQWCVAVLRAVARSRMVHGCAAIYPGEHHEMRYEAVVIVCHLEESTESDYGGVLLYTVDGEDIIAYLEERGSSQWPPPARPFPVPARLLHPAPRRPGTAAHRAAPLFTSSPHLLFFPVNPKASPELLPRRLTVSLLSASDMAASVRVAFQVSPRRMSEWIEYHLHMGVDRIVVYDAGAVDAEVVAMLDAYTEQDISIQIVNLRQVKSYPSWDNGRLLTTNDCMYRHRFTARYATPLPAAPWQAQLLTSSWQSSL